MVEKSFLLGGEGDIIQQGELNADALDSGDGGLITIESKRIANLADISADAKGLGQGGEVDLYAEQTIALQSDSLITANADSAGDGGKVVVYSPDTTLFRGGAKITATGGANSGDGGFVEVSGRELVEVYGEVNVGAANGRGGLWYIDPINIDINDGGSNNTFNMGIWDPNGAAGSATIDVNQIENALQNGDVEISTATGNGGAGRININTVLDVDRAQDDATLTLTADTDITFNSAGGITDSVPNTLKEVNLVLNAGNDIRFFADSEIKLNDGNNSEMNIVANAGNNIEIDQDAVVNAGDGSIRFIAGNDIKVAGLTSSHDDSDNDPAIYLQAGNQIVDGGDARLDINFKWRGDST